MKNKIYVWDLPTRLFHWLLVALVVFQFISGNIGGNIMAFHVLSGCVILTLLLFRVAWGFVGSTQSRFATFVRGPGVIAAYLRGESHYLGHNPLGGLSVVAMLMLLLGIATTGLFANDDIMTEGPLMGYISKHLSDSLTTYHKWGTKLLMALVALHLGAIAFYTRVKKESLVLPMITGYKTLPGKEADTPERITPTWLALIILLVAAGLVVAVIVTAPPSPIAEY